MVKYEGFDLLNVKQAEEAVLVLLSWSLQLRVSDIGVGLQKNVVHPLRLVPELSL